MTVTCTGTISIRFAELLERRDDQAVRGLFADLPVQDIADAIGDCGPAERADAFRLVAEGLQPEVFAHLDDVRQESLVETLTPDEMRRVMNELSPDDRTALLERLPRDAVKRLLWLLKPGEVREAVRLLGYPEESAGRLMTPDCVKVRGDWSVARALAHIRQLGDERETVNLIYVTEGSGRLLDIVSLRQLVFANPAALVSSLADESLITIQPDADREEAVRLIQHYDLSALPVVDVDGRLLGIVTVDDVMDVAEEEATEDFHKMGSVGALHLSLKDARPFLLYRKRIGWLVMLVAVNGIGAIGIKYFEASIEAVVALVFFLPLVIASGGNAGAQAATLMVRALATGDVHARDWLGLFIKELSVALALGLTMGLFVWAAGSMIGGGGLGLAVALAMICVVLVSSLFGLLLPFVLERMNFDPATASAPLITSVADIAGIAIYFLIATVILGLPMPGA
ncbi:MAG: magnesium transporter [Xanthomonadaceae bacterium]|nr:magnesium transporter [Xanthomonadaceae bacterium]